MEESIIVPHRNVTLFNGRHANVLRLQNTKLDVPKECADLVHIFDDTWQIVGAMADVQSARTDAVDLESTLACYRVQPAQRVLGVKSAMST